VDLLEAVPAVVALGVVDVVTAGVVPAEGGDAGGGVVVVPEAIGVPEEPEVCGDVVVEEEEEEEEEW
jgi:hypothetical protein